MGSYLALLIILAILPTAVLITVLVWLFQRGKPSQIGIKSDKTYY